VVPLITTAFSQLLAGKDQVYQSNLFGGAVRLAFHDAGEVDLTASDTAGPDGCLSTADDNAGLLESTSVVTSIIEPMWQTYCDQISRADFWALIGKLAVEASEPTKAISIPYYYGRTDNSACEAGHGRLPGSEGTVSDMSKVFVTRMGMSMTDVGELNE
jgi:catalase (peroxidase I)